MRAELFGNSFLKADIFERFGSIQLCSMTSRTSLRISLKIAEQPYALHLLLPTPI
mgnify:CR=1 FL=1